MFLSAAFVSSGNRTSGVAGSVQLFPKSSLHASSAPQCMLAGAAQMRRRPARPS